MTRHYDPVDHDLTDTRWIYISDDGNWGDAMSLTIIDTLALRDEQVEAIVETLDMYGPVSALQKINKMDIPTTRFDPEEPS